MCLLTDLIAPKPHYHRAKLAHTVPFKVAINISPPDRLVQIAFYMPESQLHLHSCNNEPSFIGKGCEIGINTNGLERRGAR